MVFFSTFVSIPSYFRAFPALSSTLLQDRFFHLTSLRASNTSYNSSNASYHAWYDASAQNEMVCITCFVFICESKQELLQTNSQIFNQLLKFNSNSNTAILLEIIPDALDVGTTVTDC